MRGTRRRQRSPEQKKKVQELQQVRRRSPSPPMPKDYKKRPCIVSPPFSNKNKIEKPKDIKEGLVKSEKKPLMNTEINNVKGVENKKTTETNVESKKITQTNKYMSLNEKKALQNPKTKETLLSSKDIKKDEIKTKLEKIESKALKSISNEKTKTVVKEKVPSQPNYLSFNEKKALRSPKSKEILGSVDVAKKEAEQTSGNNNKQQLLSEFKTTLKQAFQQAEQKKLSESEMSKPDMKNKELNDTTTKTAQKITSSIQYNKEEILTPSQTPGKKTYLKKESNMVNKKSRSTSEDVHIKNISSPYTKPQHEKKDLPSLSEFARLSFKNIIVPMWNSVPSNFVDNILNQLSDSKKEKKTQMSYPAWMLREYGEDQLLDEEGKCKPSPKRSHSDVTISVHDIYRKRSEIPNDGIMNDDIQQTLESELSRSIARPPDAIDVFHEPTKKSLTMKTLENQNPTRNDRPSHANRRNIDMDLAHPTFDTDFGSSFASTVDIFRDLSNNKVIGTEVLESPDRSSQVEKTLFRHVSKIKKNPPLNQCHESNLDSAEIIDKEKSEPLTEADNKKNPFSKDDTELIVKMFQKKLALLLEENTKKPQHAVKGKRKARSSSEGKDLEKSLEIELASKCKNPPAILENKDAKCSKNEHGVYQNTLQKSLPNLEDKSKWIDSINSCKLKVQEYLTKSCGTPRPDEMYIRSITPPIETYQNEIDEVKDKGSHNNTHCNGYACLQDIKCKNDMSVLSGDEICQYITSNTSPCQLEAIKTYLIAEKANHNLKSNKLRKKDQGTQDQDQIKPRKSKSVKRDRIKNQSTPTKNVSPSVAVQKSSSAFAIDTEVMPGPSNPHGFTLSSDIKKPNFIRGKTSFEPVEIFGDRTSSEPFISSFRKRQKELLTEEKPKVKKREPIKRPRNQYYNPRQVSSKSKLRNKKQNKQIKKAINYLKQEKEPQITSEIVQPKLLNNKTTEKKTSVPKDNQTSISFIKWLLPKFMVANDNPPSPSPEQDLLDSRPWLPSSAPVPSPSPTNSVRETTGCPSFPARQSVCPPPPSPPAYCRGRAPGQGCSANYTNAVYPCNMQFPVLDTDSRFCPQTRSKVVTIYLSGK